jgi:hypothetical protein
MLHQATNTCLNGNVVKASTQDSGKMYKENVNGYGPLPVPVFWFHGTLLEERSHADSQALFRLWKLSVLSFSPAWLWRWW